MRKELMIAQGAHKIKPGEYADSDCEAVVFPEGLEEIGEEAFAGCGELRYLRIPDGVKKIGAGAFRGCVSMMDVFIPKSVEEIGENAFTDSRLIYCEVSERPKGWFYQWEELPHAISDESLENQRVASWCGSYEFHLTFDEFIAEGKHYELDSERKVIWRRSWEYFAVDENTGEWHFDQLKFLSDLGEEWLNKGRVPNCNPVAEELREEIRTKMENRYVSNKSIGGAIQQYVNVIALNYWYPQHAGEFMFEMWSLYFYARRIAESSSMPLRRNWIRPLTMEMDKYSEMLEKLGGEAWTDIRDRMESAARLE